jgi:hypothetical protein
MQAAADVVMEISGPITILVNRVSCADSTALGRALCAVAVFYGIMPAQTCDPRTISRTKMKSIQ